MSLQSPKSAINPSTPSIAWPDSMMSGSATREDSPEDALTSKNRSQKSSGYHALLARLEISLQGSHKALMARDTASLEQLTLEQASILEDFSRVRLELPFIHGMSSSFAKLRRAEERVLHLGRVQCALLSRMQKWSNILSNMTGGGRSDRLRSQSEPGGSGRHHWL